MHRAATLSHQNVRKQVSKDIHGAVDSFHIEGAACLRASWLHEWHAPAFAGVSHMTAAGTDRAAAGSCADRDTAVIHTSAGPLFHTRAYPSATCRRSAYVSLACCLSRVSHIVTGLYQPWDTAHIRAGAPARRRSPHNQSTTARPRGKKAFEDGLGWKNVPAMCCWLEHVDVPAVSS